MHLTPSLAKKQTICDTMFKEINNHGKGHTTKQSHPFKVMFFARKFSFSYIEKLAQRMFHGYTIQSWLIGPIVPYSRNWNKIKKNCTKIFHFIFKSSCFIYHYVDYNSHLKPLPH